MARKEKTIDGLMQEWAEDIAARAHEAFTYQCGRIRGRCQSPIEEILGMSIFYQMRDWIDDADADMGGAHWMMSEYTWPDESATPFDGVFCFQQARIGNYRPDFLFVIQDRTRSVRKALVVECDGHAFHERTKQQAAHDRSRDRWMTSNDVTVLRFTGSEIWRDPVGAGEEVCELISNLFYGRK